jgi:hypothetical protein
VGDRRKLVLDFLDAQRRDSGAWQRAKQDATQRVTQRRSKAGVQWLRDEADVRIGLVFYFNPRGF